MQMIHSLITSKTRIKLLLRFFLNPDSSGYLRELASDFGESTNSIRVELNKLSEAHVIDAKSEGRNKVYRANRNHPLFTEIRNIVLKSTGIDKVLENIIHKIGDLELAFIRGDYAKGNDSGLIDLTLVGVNLNHSEIDRVRQKTEMLIDRKINILILSPNEYLQLKSNFERDPKLILYTNQSRKND